ncbi:hypothetical protein IAT38_006486 [Cryptococcus sp. DSM 104549]
MHNFLPTPVPSAIRFSNSYSSIPPSPSVSLASWAAQHVPVKLRLQGKMAERRGPDGHTVAAFKKVGAQGVRVVYNPELNHRLKAALLSGLPDSVPLPPTLKTYDELCADHFRDRPVDSEVPLSAIMWSTFWMSAEMAMDHGVVEARGARWELCPTTDGQSVSGFKLVLPSDDPALVASDVAAGETVLAICAAQMPSDLIDRGDVPPGDQDLLSTIVLECRRAGVVRVVLCDPKRAGNRWRRARDTLRKNLERRVAHVREKYTAKERELESAKTILENIRGGRLEDWAGSGKEGTVAGEVKGAREDAEALAIKAVMKAQRALLRAGIKVIVAEFAVTAAARDDEPPELKTPPAEGNPTGKSWKSTSVALALDKRGEVIRGMSHGAKALAQVWGELCHYRPTSNIAILSTYENWLPIESDRRHPGLLLVGHPIRRDSAQRGTGLGGLTPMQLALSVALPRDPPPTITSYLDLPTTLANNDGTASLGAVVGAETVQHMGMMVAVDDSGRSNALAKDNGVRTSLHYSLSPTLPHLHHPNHFLLAASPTSARICGHTFTSLASLFPPADQPSFLLQTAFSTASPSPLPLNLVLESFAGFGRLAKAYRASISFPDSPTATPNSHVIAKFILPGTFNRTRVGQDWRFTSSHDAKEAARREVRLYEGALRHLQGTAVPWRFGTYKGWLCADEGKHYEGLRVFVEVMEDVGEPVAEESKLHTLPWADKMAILDLYKSLHSARVLHVDVESRHIRRRANGSLALIDFDIARKVRRGRNGDAELREEMDRLRMLLGVGGSASGGGVGEEVGMV